MGQAILAGWLDAKGDLVPGDFCVIEHAPEKCESLHEEYGISAFTSLAEAHASAAQQPDIYVLAVKPQVMPEVLDDLGKVLAESASPVPLVVSIAAGITTAQIAQALPSCAHIVRVMPNTPLQVGAGATVVCAGPNATSGDVSLIRDMFAQLGIAEVVSEADIDAVCALSGGAPAYTASIIEALTSAGVEQGLSAELAERLVLQTIYGTCKLMEETGATPAQTRIAVCSPGGTTLAALGAMEDAGLAESIHAGIAAAVARAKELASC